jgi:hypothetical protein
MFESLNSPGRRTLLHLAAAAAGASIGGNAARAANRSNGTQVGGLHTGMIGYMLPHEQFIGPDLAKIGSHASQAGFDLLANSDHFQPWQANQGHAAAAWSTMAATGAQAPKAWLGTTVTCPTFRYGPAVVAQVSASLSHLYPGRVFLGVGSARRSMSRRRPAPGRNGRSVGIVSLGPWRSSRRCGQEIMCRTKDVFIRWRPSYTIPLRGPYPYCQQRMGRSWPANMPTAW